MASGSDLELDQLGQLLPTNGLFEDDNFQPSNESICIRDSFLPSELHIQWKRPSELHARPRFIVDDRRRFRLKTGDFGHHPMVVCLTALFDFRGLFYRICPADQGFDKNYKGLFRFRFWWGAEWVQVLIDDRLPVVNGELLFVQSFDGDQFWPALLEKAYAKLHGSYEALKYTSESDILSELTGGTVEVIQLGRINQSEIERFRLLSRSTTIAIAVQDNSDRPNNGILSGRPYGLMSIEPVTVEQDTVANLIRLQQPPPGDGLPYSGSWATIHSPMWTKVDARQRSCLNHVDGGFWMTTSEVETCFSRLLFLYLDGDTCQSEPRLCSLRPFQVRSFRSNWRRGVSAGGCRNNIDTFHINPQLLLNLATDESTMISLVQNRTREPKAIGFSVYQVANASRCCL